MHRGTDAAKKVITYVAIVLFALFFLFPLIWMVAESTKPEIEEFSLGFIPWLQYHPTGKHWHSELISQGSENIHALMNSTIIGLSTAVIATILGLLAGYALARYEFRKPMKNVDILMWFLSLRFLPPIALAIPFYFLLLDVHLLDTQLAVILVHSASFLPYSVLVLRDAFRSLPRDMEEAAMVDGCSESSVLWRIALPLVAPALAAVFILIFSFSWNEFLLAFVLTSRYAVPMTVRLAGTVTTVGVLFYILSTRQLIAVIPPIALGLLVQRYIVSGLTMGAVKG